MREIVNRYIDPKFRTIYVTGMKIKPGPEKPICNLELSLEGESHEENAIRFIVPCSSEEHAIIDERIRNNPVSRVRFQLMLLDP